MKLDRNKPDGKNKFALICLRKIPTNPKTAQELAEAILKNPDCVDFGEKGSDGEFFVIRLKDVGAPAALEAYAHRMDVFDNEYANEVHQLAIRAGQHPNKKYPD